MPHNSTNIIILHFIHPAVTHQEMNPLSYTETASVLFNVQHNLSTDNFILSTQN